MRTLLKIEAITEIGTFTFAPHHLTAVSPYDALVAFEANNWQMFGMPSYKTYWKWDDGTETSHTYDCINASAYLAAEFDEELADEIDREMQAQY